VPYFHIEWYKLMNSLSLIMPPGTWTFICLLAYKLKINFEDWKKMFVILAYNNIYKQWHLIFKTFFFHYSLEWTSVVEHITHRLFCLTTVKTSTYVHSEARKIFHAIKQYFISKLPKGVPTTIILARPDLTKQNYGTPRNYSSTLSYYWSNIIHIHLDYQS